MNTQTKYEILTPDGWSDFHGVRKQIARSILTLSFDNTTTLECSLDHKLECKWGFCAAQNLIIGDEVMTLDGFAKLTFIHQDNNEKPVYDALHVDKGNKYYTNGLVSHNCEFLGSSGTLISGSKLKELFPDRPLMSSEGLIQYERPEKNQQYVITADVARGKGLDYSTFTVFNITEMPYRQAAVFRDNYIGPIDFASVLNRIGMVYNTAGLLVEINDIGGQVVDVLHLDYGYENLLYTQNSGRSGKVLSGGFGKNVENGIRTTKTVKGTGCSMMKMLIEQNQLLIRDYDTIQELSRFSKKANSFEAEPGFHDDLVMNLVLFSWMTEQAYFKDMTNINTLIKLREKTDEQIEEEMMPFGFIDDGGDVLYEDDGLVL